MDIKQKVGARVREIRNMKGLSQEKLAELASLDRTYIPSIEKGTRNISISVIEKLSKAFEISISDFLKGL